MDWGAWSPSGLLPQGPTSLPPSPPPLCFCHFSARKKREAQGADLGPVQPWLLVEIVRLGLLHKLCLLYHYSASAGSRGISVAGSGIPGAGETVGERAAAGDRSCSSHWCALAALLLISLSYISFQMSSIQYQLAALYSEAHSLLLKPFTVVGNCSPMRQTSRQPDSLSGPCTRQHLIECSCRRCADTVWTVPSSRAESSAAQLQRGMAGNYGQNRKSPKRAAGGGGPTTNHLPVTIVI